MRKKDSWLKLKNKVRILNPGKTKTGSVYVFTRIKQTSKLRSKVQEVSKSTSKPTVNNLVSSKQKTDPIRDRLVNLVEHLAAKEPEIPLVETKTRAKRRGSTGLGFRRIQGSYCSMTAGRGNKQMFGYKFNTCGWEKKKKGSLV